MKRILPLLLTVLLLAVLTSCGSRAPEDAAATSAHHAETASVETAVTAEPEPAPTESAAADAASAESAPGARSGVLVAYFSATGTTRGVAEKIAAITGGDLYEIVPAEPYSDADLNWNDRNSRSTKEQNDKNARPEIGSESISLEGYKKIFIGFPIWWGEEPRIMDTFVESYSFDGITMIPFCTSSSSGIGRSGQNLAENAGSGNWLEGKRFSGSVSEADLQSWIDSLK